MSLSSIKILRPAIVLFAVLSSQGIQLDIETPDLQEVSEEPLDFRQELDAALTHLRRILDPDFPLQEAYPVKRVTYCGKK